MTKAMINLVSDTVTRPDKGMLEFMMQASVGDDVFGEDPTVNELQQKIATMFGKEAALFCPSGTMTNQIAIKIHTHPLDELICDIDSHVYQSETGGYAFHSGVAVNLIQGMNGKITAEEISSAVKPGFDWQPISRLVVLENTCNKGGGSYYSLDEVQDISTVCHDKNLALHLDGARLFNALVETGEDTHAWGKSFDTISVCMSKGLGAPVGSLLIGSFEQIRQARRLRKVMGGGMRQAGYLAAACIYALNHNIDRLKTDNARARQAGELLATLPYVKSVKPTFTNIVIFTLQDDIKDHYFLEKLKAKGILAAPFGGNTIRFVYHLDISEQMAESALKELPSVL
ncbi:MAG: aminotransferase class I/II-fold pyridoxal phosphate-dependent enzyme [Saprospiraceae bacterium]|jgi:threonine aldolase|nr:aminotransferase class I/II-fold pyridoxal phosphate-dependent enzyme [Saprospiraceae bacterium]